MNARVVAVDGPAGSGKSSVSRAAAAELGFAFLDTGAAYRALTWLALERGVPLLPEADEDAVLALLPGFDYRIGLSPNEPNAVHVGLTDVTQAIREARVAANVSAVARIAGVRDYLVAMYRRTIADCTMPGIVVEGRDITTVVAPHAEVRVLLTARPEVRAARRAGENGGSAEAVAVAIAERDSRDLANADFMTPANGVTVLDTSDLSFAESVAALVDLVNAA
ncbi:MAG TPA: (d)CMP kinase [Microbacteriaceae bacterium]|nr:(d)CMP kinase [Microbacteriaceae bacterium]